MLWVPPERYSPPVEEPYKPPHWNFLGFLRLDLRPQFIEQTRADLLEMLPEALQGESKHKGISI